MDSDRHLGAGGRGSVTPTGTLATTRGVTFENAAGVGPVEGAVAGMDPPALHIGVAAVSRVTGAPTGAFASPSAAPAGGGEARTGGETGVPSRMSSTRVVMRRLGSMEIARLSLAGGESATPASPKASMTAMHDLLLPPLGRLNPQSASNTWSLADAARLAAGAQSSRRRDAEDEAANNAVFKLPFYAAGYAFPMDTLQTFLVSAYFNPEISRFAEQLLMPDPKYGSRLICEPVPRRFHGRTYRDLWREMLSLYDAVVIGIYRSKAAAGALLPFVYLTPMPNAPLYSAEDDEDLMYVLSRQPLFVGQNARAKGELVGMEDVFGTISADGADVLASGTAEALAANQRRRDKEAAEREERRSKTQQQVAGATAGRGAGAAATATTSLGAASPAAAVTHVPAAGGRGGGDGVLRVSTLGPPEVPATTRLPGAIVEDSSAPEDDAKRARRASQRSLEALAAAEAETPFGGSRRRSSGGGPEALAAAVIASSLVGAGDRGRGGPRRSSNFGGSPPLLVVEETGPDVNAFA